MRHRILVSLALGAVTALLWFARVPVAAQSQTGGAPIAAATASTAPRTPWGDSDLQGVWTLNDMHGVPIERPVAATGKIELTTTEAAARRERATQAGIWGYDREWRDTALGFVKTAPSNQLSLIIDPPDGRIPPLTPEGQKRTAMRAARGSGLVEGSTEALRPGLWATDLSPYVRCITRGLPEMWIPLGYNNGVQIVQGPGNVVVTKEMVHEARVISLDRRTDLGPRITQWLGDSRGRWDGDTLVVETVNFDDSTWLDGDGSFHSDALRVVERFSRKGDTLVWDVTAEDSKVFAKPFKPQLRTLVRAPEGVHAEQDFGCVEMDQDLLTTTERH